MVSTIKFSEFTDGGTLAEGSVTVGLADGSNAKFTSSTQFQLPGTTAERPDPATDGMIRYNTDLSQYEYYNGVLWAQFENSADIALLIARLAAHTTGDGASMIGLEDQGSVSNKTVQDLAEADFIVKSVTSSLANAIALSGLSTGILVNETATGNLVARTITGTTDQIDVADGTGLSANPTLSIASNPTLPGSAQVVIPFGTTAQRPGVPSNGYFRYNTDLDQIEYYDNNAAAWVQPGIIDSVTGTSNQIDVGGTTTDPVLSLSSTLIAPGTISTGSTITSSLEGFVSGNSSPGGVGGYFKAFSTTANMGSSTFQAIDNSGDYANVLQNAPTTDARTWTLPDASGTLALTSGASGIVNSGVINELAYYATTGDAVSGLTTANRGFLITDDTGAPSIENTVLVAPDQSTNVPALTVFNDQEITYPVSASFSTILGYSQDIQMGTTQEISPTVPGGFNNVYGNYSLYSFDGSNTNDVRRLTATGQYSNISWTNPTAPGSLIGSNINSTFAGSGIYTLVVTGQNATASLSCIAGESKTGATTARGLSGAIRLNGPGSGSTFSGINGRGVDATALVNLSTSDAIVTFDSLSLFYGGAFTVNGGSGSSSLTVTNLYGLYLPAASISGNATVTNQYGVYSADASASNYFAGAVEAASLTLTAPLPVTSGGTGTTTSTGTGSVVLSNTPTLVTPDIGAATGTSINLGSSTTINGFIDDDTFATASATTGATSESIKAYVDTTSGGLVDSVTGTANQVDVDNTDPANPILSLSSTIQFPGTTGYANGNGILDENGNEQILFNTTASAVNYVDLTNAATGSGPLLQAAGSDTDIDLRIQAKGTGDLVLDGLKWPQADGTNGQALITDGAGQTSWSTISGGGGGDVAVGTIFFYGGTSAPTGALVCDGSAVSRTTYSELYTAIGDTWGAGDGSTTFNLPNGERSVLVGSGGTGTGTLGNAVGDTGGAETVTLTTANMPAGTPITSGTSGGINVVSNTGAASYVPQNSSPYSGGSASAVNIIQPSTVGLMCIQYQPNATTAASAASQAEMEAASSNTVFSTPGRQQFHPGHPKAWVIYNQATGPSVVASYNVTSVTDNSAGLYTVNWDTDFSDTNYSVLVSTIGAGSGNNAVTCSATAGTRAVGSQQFLTQQLTSALDRDGNCVAAFGDQA